jgi:hypothetical protein
MRCAISIDFVDDSISRGYSRAASFFIEPGVDRVVTDLASPML